MNWSERRRDCEEQCFFAPEGDEKVLTEGLRLDMDSLILDLEDSIVVERKISAREAVLKRYE